MTIFARILLSCFSLCLLTIASTSHASRPAMNEHPGTPLAAPEDTAVAEDLAADPEITEYEETRRGSVLETPVMTRPGATPATQTTDAVPAEAKPVAVKPDQNLNASVQLLDFPRRGMGMDKVQNELGQPLTKHAAIGEPPITRWSYTDRVVYFEGSKVIHVVATQ